MWCRLAHCYRPSLGIAGRDKLKGELLMTSNNVIPMFAVNKSRPVMAITGVGGFIGRHVAERARIQGWDVRGIEIDERRAERVAATGVEVEVGDVADQRCVQRCFVGADHVVHAAGVLPGRDSKYVYDHHNILGSANVAIMAAQCQVRRLVHISSLMVHGFNFKDGIKEDGPLRPGNDAYHRSKFLAERAVRHCHSKNGLEVVVLRPGRVYGANSDLWVRRPIELLKNKRFFMPADAGMFSHVYIDNLVDAVWLALTHNVAGDLFSITDGQSTSAVEFYQQLADIVQKTFRTLPSSVSTGLGVLAKPMQRLAQTPLGKLPGVEFVHTNVSNSGLYLPYMQIQGQYTIEKARRRLKYEPRIMLEQGMSELSYQLLQEGVVPKPKRKQPRTYISGPPM